ncbi:hypothetical protein FSARC_11831 [Fusarium sarcochroum]|uniref:Subtilisin-like serine protease n=1 Tax=Fusarium sarcochroum TaxID=1208366 RepID=A0A8H4TCP7_9HYPO|nr:hypothetical protein FSARC_11831 [Fusarium sarcochroum]
MRNSSLIPPFTKSKALRSASSDTLPLHFLDHNLLPVDPRQNTDLFLEADLSTSKINVLLPYLWWAGLPRAPRPLHRQQLLRRTIFLTERADEHLVWHETKILIKPVPEYLLDYDLWQQSLCRSDDLYRSACGLLLSYAWLISSKSDLRIAHDTGILPSDIRFNDWIAFMMDFTCHVDAVSLHQVHPRYGYGELRLTRLNMLYRVGAAGLSARNFVYGFMPLSTRYTSFFERYFGWILAVFFYITVVLSALQVAVSTDQSQDNANFQTFCYEIALVAIGFVLAAIMIMVVVWSSLFWFHLLSTRRYCKRVNAWRKDSIEATRSVNEVI